MIVLDLIHNLAILIALTFLAGLLEELFKKDTTLKYVTQGILFGIVTVIVMLNPFTLTEGLFFDGRTIVIGICTLFFGPLAGIIAAVIAAGYRIYIGGIGLFTGLLTTFGAVLTGYITYLIRKKTNFRFTSYHYSWDFPSEKSITKIDCQRIFIMKLNQKIKESYFKG